LNFTPIVIGTFLTGAIMRARCFHRSGSMIRNRFVGGGGARGGTPHLRSTMITARSIHALVRMSLMSRYSNLRLRAAQLVGALP